MTVYEEYKSPAEKRAAQKGAKRGKPTGMSRGFIFVMDKRSNCSGNLDIIASFHDMEPGCKDPDGSLGCVSASHEYVRTHCRRVGGCHLPQLWREKWNYFRTPE